MKRNVVNKLMAVLALGFAFAGCGVAPEEELLPISSTEAALANNGGYATREVCEACGCVASDKACDCGTRPAQTKLDCIDNGGPVKKELRGQIATGPASVQPELKIPDPSPYPSCLPGQVLHCTLGPPPVCWCIPITLGTLAQ